MIDLALAAVLSTTSLSPAQYQSAKAALVDCAPKTEKAALACVRRHVPAAMQREIVVVEQPNFGPGSDSKARNLLFDAWLQHPSPLDALDAHYANAGYPASAMSIDVVLESFWLQERGCRYSQRERLRVTRELEEYDAQLFADALWEREHGVHVFHFGPTAALKVDCRKWSDPAR